MSNDNWPFVVFNPLPVTIPDTKFTTLDFFDESSVESIKTILSVAGVTVVSVNSAKSKANVTSPLLSELFKPFPAIMLVTPYSANVKSVVPKIISLSVVNWNNLLAFEVPSSINIYELALHLLLVSMSGALCHPPE